MESAKSFKVVLVTVGSLSNAKRIATALLEDKLAACVNIVPQIRSIYEWKGKVCQGNELLLIIKTQGKLLNKLEKVVRKNHTYDVPEIVSLSLHKGSEPYLDWIRKALQ